MKNMLVLTDFSDTALNAAKYAASLTHQLGTEKIILYHSYEVTPIVTTVPLPSPAAIIDLQEKSLIRLNHLKNALLSLISDKTVIEVVANDVPLLSAINALITQYQITITIMGITGKSGFERALIGSNTIRVAEQSSLPLLLIPHETVFERIVQVVLASDLEKVAETSPVLEIKKIIQALNAQLYVLNVTSEPEHFDPDMLEEQTALHELWDSEDPQYYYTDREDTAEGIMDFVEEHDIQLVIVVPKKRGLFERIFHRSMSKKLAFHTHIPLLLLKGEE